MQQQPKCIHYGECGGCSLQHLTADEIIERKTQRLADKIDFPQDPLIIAHGRGRRRVTWHMLGGVLGYSKARSHELVAITECPILEPALQAALPLARSLMKIVDSDGDIHMTTTDNGLDVHIKTSRPLNSRQRPRILAFAPEMARCTMNGELVLQTVEPFISIHNHKVPLPLTSFLQATKLGEETLIELVTSNLKKSKSVVELFCGLGTFTLPIAKTVKVTAFEQHRDSLEALKRTINHTQGLKPIVTMERDLFRSPVTTKELNEFDCVVIDPPRAGADRQFEAIAKSTIKRVLSVSCNIDTFARDAKILTDAGFVIEKLTPVDQFQFSEHLETFAVFTRK